MVAEARSARQDPFFSTTAADARADRGRREIAISADRVTIRRRLKGIGMNLCLAMSAYRGVALCLCPGQDGKFVYQIRLVHRDADLSVTLDEAADDTDIVADWRLWARVLGRPALAERAVGEFETVSADPEVVERSGVLARRKRPLKRRPRFLARRRAGASLEHSAVFAGEREIIARS